MICSPDRGKLAGKKDKYWHEAKQNSQENCWEETFIRRGPIYIKINRQFSTGIGKGEKKFTKISEQIKFLKKTSWMIDSWQFWKYGMNYLQMLSNTV